MSSEKVTPSVFSFLSEDILNGPHLTVFVTVMQVPQARKRTHFVFALLIIRLFLCNYSWGAQQMKLASQSILDKPQENIHSTVIGVDYKLTTLGSLHNIIYMVQKQHGAKDTALWNSSFIQ